MTIEKDVILKNGAIADIVARCEALSRDPAFTVSDIIERTEAGVRQYVDLVMEGGGVLGVALLGYIYALEKAGLRFLSIGGTSAGSIAAMLLMAIGKRDEPRGPTLIELLFNMDLRKFVDGDDDAREFSLMLGDSAQRGKKVKLAWKGMQVVDNLVKDIGLNPGDAFLKWLSGHLKDHGVGSLNDLNNKTAYLPPVENRNTGKRIEKLALDLGIVAADISTETKAVFPAFAPLYWNDPASVNPAYFVRASMSIPGFFHPLRISGIGRITDRVRRWNDIASYSGFIPATAVFVDGGIMSNFPIDLFHEPGVPLAPTLGVKLGPRSRTYNEIDGVFAYAGALFNAMRHYADYDFIIRHPEYRELIAFIDTRGHDWLNFSMSEKEKVELFSKGVAEAWAFLNRFKWDAYKAMRSRQS